ncbi:hypothetical protein HOLleu_34689 [Holothuria leucospilota]|uniref:Uncharacterized protein n=1 Tax=Holothuria leucospilota TaxID=206669 RepID=A0A9Q1BGF0_HOLLE|nr:hypothetical protein HOLleu_34689 [Holothuria leucospilota]
MLNHVMVALTCPSVTSHFTLDPTVEGRPLVIRPTGYWTTLPQKVAYSKRKMKRVDILIMYVPKDPDYDSVLLKW